MWLMHALSLNCNTMNDYKDNKPTNSFYDSFKDLSISPQTPVLYNYYFLNGSVVTATNEKICYDIMLYTYNNTKYFWASELMEGLWDVQFSPEIFPDVYITASANTGMTAAFIAKQNLYYDMTEKNIIKIEDCVMW